MKLSDAMSLGAMQGPQLFHELFNDDSGGTCAMGAALLGAGMLKRWSIGIDGLDVIVEKFPVLSTETFCPGCGYKSAGGYELITLWYMIVHLNNCHHWTRERIASWVATVEAQYEADQPVDQPIEREEGVLV